MRIGIIRSRFVKICFPLHAGLGFCDFTIYRKHLKRNPTRNCPSYGFRYFRFRDFRHRMCYFYFADIFGRNHLKIFSSNGVKLHQSRAAAIDFEIEISFGKFCIGRKEKFNARIFINFSVGLRVHAAHITLAHAKNHKQILRRIQ